MSTKPSLILTRLDVQRLERLIDSLDESTPGVLVLQDELDRAERQVARLRSGDGLPEPGEPALDAMLPPQSPAALAPAVGPRGSRHRIEPKMGAVA